VSTVVVVSSLLEDLLGVGVGVLELGGVGLLEGGGGAGLLEEGGGAGLLEGGGGGGGVDSGHPPLQDVIVEVVV